MKLERACLKNPKRIPIRQRRLTLLWHINRTPRPTIKINNTKPTKPVRLPLINDKRPKAAEFFPRQRLGILDNQRLCVECIVVVKPRQGYFQGIATC